MTEPFWTPGAVQDRDEIYDHIEADNPVAAYAALFLFIALLLAAALVVYLFSRDAKPAHAA